MNEDKTKQRLLKANNVQRRAYVKRFEVLAKRAKRFFLNDKRDAQARVENKLVEREMGADLDTLLDLRSQIQDAKIKQHELVRQAEAVREELREKKGLTIQSSSYGRSAWDYYVNPPMVDTPDDPDVCKKDLGNEDVQFTVRRCQQNPLYDELLKELTALTDKHMELENDIDRIPAQIWGVVTTDEILDLLMEFQTKWVHDTLIEDD